MFLDQCLGVCILGVCYEEVCAIHCHAENNELSNKLLVLVEAPCFNTLWRLIIEGDRVTLQHLSFEWENTWPALPRVVICWRWQEGSCLPNAMQAVVLDRASPVWVLRSSKFRTRLYRFWLTTGQDLACYCVFLFVGWFGLVWFGVFPVNPSGCISKQGHPYSL